MSEKDPKRRYSSALALAEDLEHWLKHEPIQARRTGIVARSRKWVRRNSSVAVMAAMLLVLAVPLGVTIWKSEFSRQPVTTGIAVLPFENLSEQKERGAFVDGVQDDILTKLGENRRPESDQPDECDGLSRQTETREIGNVLRVSHVLEGSVRRNAGRIHLNAQSIDTRNDTHVWAEEIDRYLSDVFAIQTEIAQKIANLLRAKVSAGEKAAIEEQPTKDLVSYDLFIRATTLFEYKATYEGGEEQTQDDFQAWTRSIRRRPSHKFSSCILPVS